MISAQHIARKNRLKNAGGKYPPALENMAAFALFFRRLRGKEETDFGILVIGLFLWLTRDLNDINSVNDIPDFFRVNNSAPCKENAFRTHKKEGGSAWCEYAHCYQDQTKKCYLWQPIPKYFNALFHRYVSKKSSQTGDTGSGGFLTQKQKQTLLDKIKRSFKAIHEPCEFPKSRKNVFFHYIIHCAQVDNTLGATVRQCLLEKKHLHHTSAAAYQQKESDVIRAAIFSAQNRYIERLMNAAHKQKLAHFFALPASYNAINITDNAISVPTYLLNPGRIDEYQSQKGNTKIQSINPPIPFGSRRYLDETDVVHFFDKLDNHIKNTQPEKTAPREARFAHYNQAGCRMALLFITLTGVRPTHSISISAQKKYGDNWAFVSDKGRLRRIYLNTYLQREIAHYQKYQRAVLSLLSHPIHTDHIWFGLDESGEEFLFSNKYLRQFMHTHWQNVVPYQLRHFFAQCAAQSRLHDQDVDRLMGHSNFGEHLGSDDIFAPTQTRLINYLERLPKRFDLQEMHYDC